MLLFLIYYVISKILTEKNVKYFVNQGLVNTFENSTENYEIKQITPIAHAFEHDF